MRSNDVFVKNRNSNENKQEKYFNCTEADKEQNCFVQIY